jgi:hypothetical protein
VSGDGRKTWSYRYWTKIGRRGRVILGVHLREFGLSEARAAAGKAQVAVDEGDVLPWPDAWRNRDRDRAPQDIR